MILLDANSQPSDWRYVWYIFLLCIIFSIIIKIIDIINVKLEGKEKRIIKESYFCGDQKKDLFIVEHNGGFLNLFRSNKKWIKSRIRGNDNNFYEYVLVPSYAIFKTLNEARNFVGYILTDREIVEEIFKK